jgi:hypothetical protein
MPSIQIKVYMRCCRDKLITNYETHVKIELHDAVYFDKCPLCGKENVAGTVIEI